MRIGVIGCSGRMGRMLIASILDTDACTLAGGIEHSSSLDIGRDLATLIGRSPIGVAVEEKPRPLFDVSDVIIDFSSPSATATNAALAAETGKALVVGTTGLGSGQISALTAASQLTPVLYSSNMSLGVNVLLSLVEYVSRVLDDNYDIEILEIHHREKVDAPSGTALELWHAVATGRGTDHTSLQMAHSNRVGKRRKGDIGFAVLRCGDIVGEHSVIFAADGEQIKLTHKASSRAIFAKGAVCAALWLQGREPGLYSMRDVLSVM